MEEGPEDVEAVVECLPKVDLIQDSAIHRPMDLEVRLLSAMELLLLAMELLIQVMELLRQATEHHHLEHMDPWVDNLLAVTLATSPMAGRLQLPMALRNLAMALLHLATECHVLGTVHQHLAEDQHQVAPWHPQWRVL